MVAIAELFGIGVMFSLALAPAIMAWVFLRRTQHQRMVTIQVARGVSQRFSSLSGGRSPIPDDPEALYIPGVGFVIGDISCQFNGRSPFLRCAINPTGPCKDCRSYQERISNSIPTGEISAADSRA